MIISVKGLYKVDKKNCFSFCLTKKDVRVVHNIILLKISKPFKVTITNPYTNRWKVLRAIRYDGICNFVKVLKKLKITV